MIHRHIEIQYFQVGALLGMFFLFRPVELEEMDIFPAASQAASRFFVFFCCPGESGGGVRHVRRSRSDRELLKGGGMFSIVGSSSVIGGRCHMRHSSRPH